MDFKLAHDRSGICIFTNSKQNTQRACRMHSKNVSGNNSFFKAKNLYIIFRVSIRRVVISLDNACQQARAATIPCVPCYMY